MASELFNMRVPNISLLDYCALASPDEGRSTERVHTHIPSLFHALSQETLLTLLTMLLPPRTCSNTLVLLQLGSSAGPFKASARLTPEAAGQLRLPSVLGLAAHTGGAFHDKARLTPKAHDFI